MNENQMNTQNVGNNESVNQNMGVPVQPMPQNVGVPPVQATNNFMEDFSQAVVPQPEVEVVPPVVPTVPDSMSEQSTQAVPVTNVEPTLEVQTVPIQPEPVVENTVDPQPTAVTEPTETVATEIEVPTKETTKTGLKKQSNWPFILAIFAIVGFFVLLFPLLVRIFGY